MFNNGDTKLACGVQSIVDLKTIKSCGVQSIVDLKTIKSCGMIFTLELTNIIVGGSNQIILTNNAVLSRCKNIL